MLILFCEGKEFVGVRRKIWEETYTSVHNSVNSQTQRDWVRWSSNWRYCSPLEIRMHGGPGTNVSIRRLVLIFVYSSSSSWW